MSESHVEHVEHVEVEPPHTEAVEAAQAAVALAETTAAAAEIDAAERVRDYATELDQCRLEIQSLGGLISASATADSEREKILSERLTLLENSLGERVASLETHPLLTRPISEAEAGATGEVTLGPAEVAASSEISSPNPEEAPSNEAPRRRRRKWI